MNTKEGQDRRVARSRGPLPLDPAVLLYVFTWWWQPV